MKRALVLLLSLALLVGACGGDDTDDTASPGPTMTIPADLPEPTETVAAQESPAGAEPTDDDASPIAEATDDQTDGASPTVGRTATAERATPEEANASPTGESTADDDDENDPELASQLLTLEDLPPGWTVTPAGDDDDSRLCNAPSLLEVFNNPAQAEISFQQSDLGPFLGQALIKPGENTASEMMEFARTNYACGEWTEDDGTVWTIDALSFPDVGDESLALRLGTTTQGFTIVFDAVFVRQGDYFVYVALAGVDEVNTDDTETFVRTALEKLD